MGGGAHVDLQSSAAHNAGAAAAAAGGGLSGAGGVADVAVVGGGVAGLAAARRLAAGHPHVRVTLVDMGRGPGGRASSRTLPDQQLEFDHGAQFFTATPGSAFEAEVHRWVAAGVAAQWHARVVALNPLQHPGRVLQPGEALAAAGGAADFCGALEAFAARRPMWVGVPSSGGLCAFLAADVEAQQTATVRRGVRVQRLERSEQGRWLLRGSTQGRPRVQGHDTQGGEGMSLGQHDEVLFADAITAIPGGRRSTLGQQVLAMSHLDPAVLTPSLCPP